MNLFRKDPEAKKRKLEEELRDSLARVQKLTSQILDTDDQTAVPERDKFEFEETTPPDKRLPAANAQQISIVYAQRFALEFERLEQRFKDRIIRSIQHYAQHNDHNPPLRKKTAGIKPANCYFIKIGKIYMVIYQLLDGKVKFLSITRC